jgi:N-methylhydantoinase A
VSSEGQIDRYPLRVPMIDLTTIGAGGGSIAWADGAGGFRVGPHSAGSQPGPACYPQGGEEPTVTDASLVLGYLNPDYFAGGTVALDPERAEHALGRLGGRIGLTAIETAAGVHRVVNAKMADAIRLVSIRRGYDPRLFALVMLGGAGPVHGGRLAQDLEIPTLVVPSAPGVLSAWGLLVASIEHDHAETVALRMDELEPGELDAAFERAAAHVAEQMKAEHVPAGAATTTRLADMRYVGQAYTLEVEFPDELDDGALEDCLARFHSTHNRIYGHARPTAPVELVNVRIVQTWREPGDEASVFAAEGAMRERGLRLAYFEEYNGYVEVPIYWRSALEPSADLVGPAIVEQMDATTVIYPGFRATSDDGGNLVLQAEAA